MFRAEDLQTGRQIHIGIEYPQGKDGAKLQVDALPPGPIRDGEALHNQWAASWRSRQKRILLLLLFFLMLLAFWFILSSKAAGLSMIGRSYGDRTQTQFLRCK